MSIEVVLERLKRHEGFSPTVYKDSLGFDTIGYGFAIKDLVLDRDISSQILRNIVYELVFKVQEKFGWFRFMPGAIQEVIVEMCFQIGISGFSKFKKTIGYFRELKWEKASIEMLDSKWAKQTPNRARELSNIVGSVTK
jgi:lysozyme